MPSLLDPRRRVGRRRGRVVAAATVAAWMFTTAVASAAFTSTVGGAGEISTATLQPPTTLGAGHGTCQAAVDDSIVLTWTASTSTWAEGYEVLRSTDGSTYAVIATLAGISTETYTDGGLAFSTTYWYRVRATESLWTSQPATTSLTTRTATCA